MRQWTAVLAGLCLMCNAAMAADSWQAAKGPLATRWTKDVSPTNALPEYPRPTMVRKDWQNLNGLWEYAILAKAAPAPSAYDGQILVPYPVESALSGVMKRVDQSQRLWYRRTFEVLPAWKGQRLLLHFGAVDWQATVSVNGKELGTHRGGYDGFTFDITDALNSEGKQELLVAVSDPTDKGGQPRGKQVLKPGGIFYTPTTGIWQTVWMEPVPTASIGKLKITPDVDGGVVRVTAQGKGTDEAYAIEVTALDNGNEVGRVSGKIGSELALPVKDAKLWSPETPFLYDLKVVLKSGDKAVDSVASYFGMRKSSLGKDEKGITRLMLNGKFVFQVGFLDQGFWPDGLYTAPTDEALRYDIEMTKKLGMNLARKHVKVEPERWYYWCDKLGLLVWQDMAAGDNRTSEDKKQFEVELARLLEGRGNHPSIIMWVVFNEGWGQHDTERLTQWVKQRDPSRLVNNASGWTDKNVGDVIDMHNYPGPGSPKPEEKRAAVLGEFGGLGLAVPGHTWTKESWGYRGMASPDKLTRTYCQLLAKAYALKDDVGLSAVVYTQTTDVETECNGLMTYDREVLKVDLAKVADANRGKVPPLPQIVTVAPTSQERGINWRYILEKPADNWFKPEFDASNWKEGPGGFGTQGTPGAVVRTEWKGADIWLRREFEMPEAKLANLCLLMHHDEDAEVYINGVLATKVGGYVSAYEDFEISPEAKAALRPGKNVLAVHCRQTGGGQYIDVGIIDMK